MKKILSLCGGGTSGYITACILDIIEKELHVSIVDSFDMISGVSTGSLVGGLLVTDRTPKEIKEIYRDVYHEVFGNKSYIRALYKSLYDTAHLRDCVGKYIGDITLGDIDKDTQFMCHAVKLNGKHLKTKFWKSWKDKHNEFLLADVLTASSCAPFAFTPFGINNRYYFDGGITTNNPSLVSSAEMLKQYGDNCKMKIMCAQTDKHKGFPKVSKLKGLRIFAKFPELSVDGSEQVTNHIAKSIFGKDYLPLNPLVYLDIDSNDWDLMERVAREMWENNKEDIIDFLGA